jgi:hypothetical protein
MSDMFASEATAFLNGYDLLKLDYRKSFADLPDKAKVRLLITQAEFLSAQRSNPLKDFTIPQLLVIDFADSWLRWCADPTNPQRWEVLFDIRGMIQDLEDEDDE